MAFDRRRGDRREGDPNGDDRERGAVLVITVAAMAALVMLGAMSLDLGAARRDRQRDSASADAIAVAGASRIDPSGADNTNACLAAWAYAQSTLTGTTTTTPPCSTTFNTACVPTTARTATAVRGDFTIKFVNPVPDTHAFMGTQAINSAADGIACKRFGVQIFQSKKNLMVSGSIKIWATSVARLGRHGMPVQAPLILLEPHGCDVMTISGSGHLLSRSANGDPGYIAVDSDGTSCATDKSIIVDTVGGGRVTAESALGVPGALAMWALSGPNASHAYSPSDVSSSPTDPGFWPEPSAASAPVGRSSIDWTYNCKVSNGCPDAATTPPYIDNLVASYGGSGMPTGFQRWSSSYSCSPSGDTVVPAGNWYIDCPTGVSTNGTITFRGGDVVADKPFNLNGSGTLRVNCDSASASINCPANPGTPSTFYLRSGDFDKTGNMIMRETFVYLASGGIDLTGNSLIDWTAPKEGNFKNLLVWTESSQTMTLNGTSDMNFEGIAFMPNANLTLVGTTGTNALRSQIFARTLDMAGTSDLTISPLLDRSAQLPTASPSLIR